MVERPQSFIDQLHRKSYLLKVIYPTVHTGSDENGSAIQKKFQVFGQSFHPIQCFWALF